MHPLQSNISRNLDFSTRRSFSVGGERDGKTGFEAFELRSWDGRIGRWKSPDLYGQFHSTYLGMGNNPIAMIDPDGGFCVCVLGSAGLGMLSSLTAGTLSSVKGMKFSAYKNWNENIMEKNVYQEVPRELTIPLEGDQVEFQLTRRQEDHFRTIRIKGKIQIEAWSNTNTEEGKIDLVTSRVNFAARYLRYLNVFNSEIGPLSNVNVGLPRVKFTWVELNAKLQKKIIHFKPSKTRLFLMWFFRVDLNAWWQKRVPNIITVKP